MDKPIIVTVGTGFATDLVQYDENGETKERQGLCKRVSTDFIQQPFRDLVSYLCDPTEDEYNLAYSQSEVELAERIEGLISTDDVVLDATKDGGYQLRGIELETIVGDKYGEIVQVTQLKHEGQIIPADSLDLRVANALGGGFYTPL